jgi:hypothetical protein
LACDCVCPGCRRPLIARKGSIREHHFAHHTLIDDKPCTIAGETALHLVAKEILARRLVLGLPQMILELDGDSEEVVKERSQDFDRADLELRSGEIVPDVVLYRGGRRLFVEFKVTHGCGPEKIHRIREMNVGTIEIALERHREATVAELERIILFGAPREWLHNPLAAEAGERLVARVSERHRKRKEKIEYFRSQYVHIRPVREPGGGEHERAARRNGFGSLLNHDVPGAGCFSVPVAEWQGKILAELSPQREVSIGRLVRALAEADLIKPQLAWVPRDITEEIARQNPDFGSPPYAVLRYLLLLTEMGMARCMGDWVATADFVRRRAAAHRTRERGLQRQADLGSMIEPILAKLPEAARASFRFKEWIKQHNDHLGAVPLHETHFEPARWRRFLSAIVALAEDESVGPDAAMRLLGLEMPCNPMPSEVAVPLPRF